MLPIEQLTSASLWTQALLLAVPTLLVWRWLAAGSPAPKGRKLEAPPSRLPFFGDTLTIASRMDDHPTWAAEISELYEGRPFEVRILGRPLAVFLSTPEMFEDVLKTQFEVFDKGDFMRECLSDVIGNGIFLADGANWAHQRKTASTLFTMKALRDSMATTVGNLIPVLHQIIQTSMAKGEPVGLVRLFNRFVMEGFAEIGFGIKLGGLESKEEPPFMAAFDTAQHVTLLRFLLPMWVWKLQRWLNVGAEKQLSDSVRVINDTVYGIIDKALHQRAKTTNQKEGDKKTTIISLFMDHMCKDDGEIDPVYLRDIVVSFLIAGRDSTAQTLCWFFYMMSQHPEVERKVRQEIAEKVPELATGSIDYPSIDQIQELSYLEAAIKETLRLYPPVPGNVKEANRDTVLCDGTFIRKGDTVEIPSYSMARLTQNWGPDAKQYNPERWFDPETGKPITVSAFKFVSFHAGPRTCLGMNLAMMELKTVTASLLSKFQFNLVEGQNITYKVSITLPVKGDLNMHVSPAVFPVRSVA